MTAINHALTGATIGLLVGIPGVALPAAFISHFICDMIPHFGVEKRRMTKMFRSHKFLGYLISDIALCGILVLALAVFQPEHWLLASVCAFLATSPDFIWVSKFQAARMKGKKELHNWFTRFSGGIQWFQRPIGAVVEIAWFAAGISVLMPFLLAGHK